MLRQRLQRSLLLAEHVLVGLTDCRSAASGVSHASNQLGAPAPLRFWSKNGLKRGMTRSSTYFEQAMRISLMGLSVHGPSSRKIKPCFPFTAMCTPPSAASGGMERGTVYTSSANHGFSIDAV